MEFLLHFKPRQSINIQLQIIFHISLSEGTVSECCKEVGVILIFENNFRNKLTNLSCSLEDFVKYLTKDYCLNLNVMVM